MPAQTTARKIQRIYGKVIRIGDAHRILELCQHQTAVDFRRNSFLLFHLQHDLSARVSALA